MSDFGLVKIMGEDSEVNMHVPVPHIVRGAHLSHHHTTSLPDTIRNPQLIVQAKIPVIWPMDC